MTGYNSPFSDRYGTETMRGAWSRVQRYRLLSGIWTEHQNKLAVMGSIPLAAFSDPTSAMTDEQVEQLLLEADEIEKRIGHDIVAYLTVYTQHAPVGVPWGAGSPRSRGPREPGERKRPPCRSRRHKRL